MALKPLVDLQQRQALSEYLTRAFPSAEAYYSGQNRERTRSLNSLINISIATAAIYGGYKYLNVPVLGMAAEFSKKYVPYLGERAASHLLSPETMFFKASREMMPDIGLAAHPKDATKKIWSLKPAEGVTTGQTWKNLFGIKGVEEARPVHLLFEWSRRVEDILWEIPRTAQLSGALSTAAFKRADFFIPGENIHGGQWAEWVNREFGLSGQGALLGSELEKHGLHYQAGKLYLGKAGTSEARLISEEAALMSLEHASQGSTESAIHFKNRLASSAVAQHGLTGFGTKEGRIIQAIPIRAKPVAKAFSEAKNLIASGKIVEAGKTILQTVPARLGSMYAHLGYKSYIDVLNEPFKALEEATGIALPRMSKFLEKYGLVGKLGMPGSTDIPLGKMMKKHALYGMGFMVGAYAAYQLTDSLMRNLPFAKHTILGKGWAGIAGVAGREADLTWSRISSATGLTRLGESFEESTGDRIGVTNILGITGSFGLAGALGLYLGGGAYQRLKHGKEAGIAWKKADLGAELASKIKYKGIGEKIASFAESRKMKLTPGKTGFILAGAAGLALSLPYILPSLASRKRPEELEAEYAGLQDVVERKGAGWLFGRSSFWGSRGQAIIPNWFRRIMIDAKEKQLYPEDLQYHPIKRFLKSIGDSYWKEKLHYADRPYSTTGPDISFSQLWGMTIGRILKPPKYMHMDELTGGGGKSPEDRQVIRPMAASEEIVLPEAGGVAQEKALTQYGFRYSTYELASRWLRTKPGLKGYIFASLKERLTGSPYFNDEYSYLENATQMDNMTRNIYESNLADAGGSSEGLRRVFESRKFTIEYRNSLRNAMPRWMPGAGDKARDFHTGDPYSALEAKGELRLPGAGLVARYPELKGIPAENYSDVYKYKTLADVAPYSSQFKLERMRMREMYAQGMLSDYEKTMFESTEDLISERKKGAVLGGGQETLTGKYWQFLKNFSRRLPTEYLTPISPSNKFLEGADPLEDYKLRMLAPEFAPWNTPIKSFLLPTARVMADDLPFYDVEKPDYRLRQEETQAYFDKLKYLKSLKLQSMAELAGRSDLAEDFGKQGQQTLFGVDPYGPFPDIMRALPENERNYFGAFAAETDPTKRARILDLTNPDMSRIYTAQWKRADLQKQVDKGKLTQDEYATAMSQLRQEQGFDVGVGDWAKYKAMGGRMRNFSNYVRTKELEKYFQDKELPAPDWLGWSPAVDLDDVKMKLILNEGCLDKEQKIFCDEIGLETISAKDVVKGTKILASDGQLYPVKAVLKRVYSGEMLRISIVGNDLDTLHVTPNHIVPVIRRTCRKGYKNGIFVQDEVSAADLLPHYNLLFPKLKLPETERTIVIREPFFKGVRRVLNKKTKRYNLDFAPCKTIIPDFSFGLFCGWWLAEGCCMKSGITFGLCQDEEHVARWLIAYAKETFGCNGNYRILREKHAIIVKIYGKYLQDLIISLFGEGAHSKHLSSRVLELPKEVLLGIMAGWQLGDGWIHQKADRDQTTLHIETVSQKLAQQSWWLLNSLGFKTRVITIHHKVTSYSFHKKPFLSYRITVGTKSHVKAFLSGKLPKLGDLWTTTKYDEETLKKFFWCKVKKIQVENKTNLEVYDFEIDNPHCYTTTGGIVHNSNIHDHQLWESRQREVWRKPYLDEAVEGIDYNSRHRSRMGVKNQIRMMMGKYGASNIEVQVDENTDIFGNTIDYDLKEDRSAEAIREMRRLGLVR